MPAPAETEEQHMRVERRGAVAVLTLSRPEVLNAFSATMGRQLEAALRDCDADEAVRAVVLTGAGRAFCAGADFSGGAGVFGAPGDRAAFSADPLRFHPWDVRKPVIAAVNGHAIGLGMTLALQCDLRLMARDARWGIVQNRRGVLPDLHSHWTLPRLVGHAAAAQILLTGATYTGEDAGRLGVVSEVLEAAEVLPRALEIADDIARNVAPVSAGITKRLLWRDPPPGRDATVDLETRLHLHLMGRADAREGVEAFLERREPRWSLTLADDWPEWLESSDPGGPGNDPEAPTDR